MREELFISEFCQDRRERDVCVDIMSWKKIIKTAVILIVILLYDYVV